MVMQCLRDRERKEGSQDKKQGEQEEKEGKGDYSIKGGGCKMQSEADTCTE